MPFDLIGDFVCEDANAPGTGDVNLAGAHSSLFVTFATRYTTGARIPYVISNESSLREIGWGTLTTGSPDVLSRDTVLANTAGTTSPLNFTGAVIVYAFPSGTKQIFEGATGLVDLRGGTLAAHGVSVQRGAIGGLITSNSVGTPNTQIDISAGFCAAENINGFIGTNSGFTLNAATTGANGLDTGSLANDTWYHIFAIGKIDGTAAAFGSTSLTPTLPSGYSLRRRIGSVKTDGSAHFLPYTQKGEDFIWANGVVDVNADTALTNSKALYVLGSIPPGKSVTARVRVVAQNSAAGAGFTFGSPYESGLVELNIVSTAANFPGGAELLIVANTSQQIAAASSAATGNTISIGTVGWRDDRGRFN